MSTMTSKHFVTKEWNSFDIRGSNKFVLKEKLKMLRGRLRWQNKNVFGWIDLRIEEEVEIINKLEDQLMQSSDQALEEVYIMRRLNQEAVWKIFI